jgi:pimeloyl-ACP methyl ester carboxylesterase
LRHTKMPHITHPNGQTTYYLDDDHTDAWRPRENILIQHGFAWSLSFWCEQVPYLAKDYRVIHRDARGPGTSSVSGVNYSYSIDAIMDELIDTLNQLGLDKVHYLGESTGGVWGELRAAKYPKRLLSITVCSSPLYIPEAAQDMLRVPVF